MKKPLQFKQVLAALLTIAALASGLTAQATVQTGIMMQGLARTVNNQTMCTFVIQSDWGGDQIPAQTGSSYTFSNARMIHGTVDVTLNGTLNFQMGTAFADVITGSSFTVTIESSSLWFYGATVQTKNGTNVSGCSASVSSNRHTLTVTIPLTVLCSLAAIFVIGMYVCVPIGALFPTWGYKFTPLTFKWFQQVFQRYHGLKAFKDSFILSLIASPITALLSMIISYLVVKRNFRGKGFIEAVSMLAMAVPGTVLGVGYIRGYSQGLFHTGALDFIYNSAAILIIVFVVRSLPTGTRSGISALRQIDKSIEESAYDMGADSFKVFMTVTLPLIKDSFLSGLVTAFVRSITAISAIILLVTPSFLLITVQINEFAEKGAFSIACAFATILIIITYGAVLLMNLFMKFFGTSRKLKEED